MKITDEKKFKKKKKDLLFVSACCIIVSVRGHLAQLVEHSLDVRRVSGSSPLMSTIKTELSRFGKARFFFLETILSVYILQRALPPCFCAVPFERDNHSRRAAALLCGVFAFGSLPFQAVFIVCAFCTSFISNICYCWLVVIKIHKRYNEMGCL